jgi:hypothetical protein
MNIKSTINHFILGSAPARLLKQLPASELAPLAAQAAVLPLHFVTPESEVQHDA